MGCSAHFNKVAFFYALTRRPTCGRLGRLVFRRSRDDRRMRARLEDAPPGLRRVVDCFGVDAAVGHVYAVMLGSTIPETTVACELLLGLAGDPGLQAEVRGWAAEGELAFEAFVRDQCAEHTFFTYGKSRRMPHTGEVCRIDHKTARTPWGVGLRACPGARIGLHTVSAVCRHVLLDYELGLCDKPPNECPVSPARLLALLGIRASDWTQTGWGMAVHHLMRWHTMSAWLGFLQPLRPIIIIDIPTAHRGGSSPPTEPLADSALFRANTSSPTTPGMGLVHSRSTYMVVPGTSGAPSSSSSSSSSAIGFIFLEAPGESADFRFF